MRRLRTQFPEELVVIGVHSAKFPAEKITANIAAAAARHGVDHPVVNDADFAVWSSYAVRAWPTVVLVDPAGKVVAQEAGELSADDFAPIIQGLIDTFAPQGLLNRSPIATLHAPVPTSQPLAFPSKLIPATGGRLFVADTGHHRILEVQLREEGRSGEIVRVFGAGSAGLADGPMGAARFHSPHGLAYVEHAGGSTLYVADTENHAIRAVDLVTETVRTVAGTGEKGSYRRQPGAAPTGVALRSPWALAALGDALLIAMAGSHQIWVLIGETQLGVFAGTGAEALVDGSRGEASFNQPSDLALVMGYLAVADAEASAIRAISLDSDPQVMTLVGQGLFDFGDVDGTGGEVRLQHPTGLATDGRLLYIADSYNHKIKQLDPTTGAVQTLIGTGEAGTSTGAFAMAQLNEPEGLAWVDGRLYIADTNNHRIVMADLDEAQVVELRLI